MITTLIIFGSNGMLGTYFTRYFSGLYKVIPLTRVEFDINSVVSLEEFLLSLDCNDQTCIINCAGMIPQRMKNRSITEYYTVNTVFPLQLSKICRKLNTHLICPTTDCVFSGKKGDYIETDFHDETDSYGISKSLGEPYDATVIRTSIIGEEVNNKYSFLEFIRMKCVRNGWDNHIWNGITCYQYCKIVHTIIANHLFWKGVRHIYSPQKKTKYELAHIIRDVYKLDSVIHKQNTVMSVDKTLASMHDLLFDIPSLEVQIEQQSRFILKS